MNVLVVLFSAMMMLWAAPKVSVTKKWNLRTVGQLISYSNYSESDNAPPDPPPPPHFARLSHVNPASSWPSHIIPVPTQSYHANPVPARSSQVNPALVNWHSIESATCHTSKAPKLVFNPETEQCFCVNNQLILTLILYVLGSQTHVIRLEPHPSYVKHWCFIDWAMLLVCDLLYL